MDQVEEVKQKVDMVTLVGEYVQLKKAGRNYKGLCPFHGEKSPSFMVNTELQIYKCFGCGKGGDCFRFMEDIEGMNFSESLQYLAKRVGVQLQHYSPNDNEKKRERMVAVNTVVAEAYHWLLLQHAMGKPALEYILARGITRETLVRYKLGFAPNDWHFLEGFAVKKKGYEVAELVAVGLVGKSERTGKYFDRFRNRLMFPLANQRGQVVGFAGRVLPSDQASQEAKYVNTAETELYHKSELLYGLDLNRSDIKREGVAVVVEGELDSIASWQAGVRHVVAIKGSALTERQVELIRRLAETVVLSLDADVAGDAAARRGIDIAFQAGLFVKVTNFAAYNTTYKDPGEMAIADPDLWKRVVEEAIPVYDFYLQSAVKRFGLDVQGKKKIGEEMMPVISKISDEIVKAHYIHLLAQTLGVREEDVRVQLGKANKPVSAPAVEVKKVAGKKSRREVLEAYVVGLALGYETLELVADTHMRALVQTSFWKRVLEKLDMSAVSVREAVGKLPAELVGQVQDVLLADNQVKDVRNEWKRAVQELEIVDIREQLDRLAGQEDGLGKTADLVKKLSELTRGK